ncbi:hypothetical protein CfE428DRAFT_1438 [Chthoniobacter flavus Ellin428]|uniref:Uncharacterized protein n=1 Tax=Chthoniobacter flavus Ellin428 TaxID=497964 RepID=B4CXZ7_9BACT|nr:hypothetical protein CfE428DRAFT_1438 [Chthoniobacter flavus Ellin428]TCO87517.1 hypothetical protein EV701_12119 [Chthoniobacter flavus]
MPIHNRPNVFHGVPLDGDASQAAVPNPLYRLNPNEPVKDMNDRTPIQPGAGPHLKDLLP